MIVTRIAPSPTGRLHVGNIRTGLINWLLARAAGGTFILRLDDTDVARSSEENVRSIRDDLAWLGMAPDREERQSARFARYDAVLEQLAAAGRAYRAYETAEELELKRRVALNAGRPPVYDRAALNLTDADHARFAEQGARPHWRFRLEDVPTAWRDLIRGDSRIDPASLSDPVVKRADGNWLYLLPSVIDDVDMGVTHVVRGEDHVTNTGIQLQMFAAMGAAPPLFGHAALLSGTEGKLSKRLGSVGVEEFRAMGIEPAALKALLARIGTSRPVEPLADDAALIAGFDIATLGRATARFDEAELQALNARIVHQLPYEAVRDRLPAGIAADEWEAIRPNLRTVAEAADWHAVIAGPVERAELADDDRAYLGVAAEAAAAIDFAGDPWGALTATLQARTGRKGKALFLPLRLALTGRPSGPDMHALTRLIGRDAAVARLREAAHP